MKTVRIALLLCTFPLFHADTLLAWGETGHALVNEAATWELPPSMPVFFHRAYPELIYLASDPDRWRAGEGSLDSANPPEHFLDYEYVADLELPPGRYAYIDLLHHSGTLRRYGLNLSSIPGFLPWRLAELEELLTVQWRLWRASIPGSPERSHIEHNIIQTAGVLGHYVGDSANPHHATINFNGWVEENPEGFANDCGTHSRFESEFVGRTMTLDAVRPLMSPLQARGPAFGEALSFIRASNAHLVELYRLDQSGAFVGRGTEASRAFAASRLATAASNLRDLWWTAWIDSEKPLRRRGES